MHFLDAKWRQKQIGDCNSPKNNGFVRKREIKMGVLIQEEAIPGENDEFFFVKKLNKFLKPFFHFVIFQKYFLKS